MFAVILSGAKQYLVKEGDKIRVEKLDTTGDSYTFDKVLLFSKDGKDVEVGTPFLDKKVQAKVIETAKGKKIKVFKMKAKKGYQKTYGHRQLYTELEITKIGA